MLIAYRQTVKNLCISKQYFLHLSAPMYVCKCYLRDNFSIKMVSSRNVNLFRKKNITLMPILKAITSFCGILAA